MGLSWCPHILVKPLQLTRRSGRSGPWFNIKMPSYQYRKFHWGYKTIIRSSCLLHQGIRDKRRVSEIDLSQPRHETAFWWRHNGPVTSQLTDPIKWPNYPLELIGIYVHINTHNKESLTQICRRFANVQFCLILLYVYIYMVWVLMEGMPHFASQITVTTSP